MKNLKQFILTGSQQKIIGGNSQIIGGPSSIGGVNACVDSCKAACEYFSESAPEQEACVRDCYPGCN